MVYTAKNLEDLIQISTDFLNDVRGKNVFAFKGEMGVGKTTFITYLAKAMGITEVVSSPTYGYVNEYESPFFGKVYHLDLYRIEREEEAYDIGIEEYLYGENMVFIEWAEKINNLLPENCVWVKMSVDKDQVRTITVDL